MEIIQESSRITHNIQLTLTKKKQLKSNNNRDQGELTKMAICPAVPKATCPISVYV